MDAKSKVYVFCLVTVVVLIPASHFLLSNVHTSRIYVQHEANLYPANITIARTCSWAAADTFDFRDYKPPEFILISRMLAMMHRKSSIIPIIRDGSFLHTFRRLSADKDMDIFLIVPRDITLWEAYTKIRHLVKTEREFQNITFETQNILISGVFYDKSDAVRISYNERKIVDVNVLHETFINDPRLQTPCLKQMHCSNSLSKDSGEYLLANRHHIQTKNLFQSLCQCQYMDSPLFCFDLHGAKYLEIRYGFNYTSRISGNNAYTLIYERPHKTWRDMLAMFPSLMTLKRSFEGHIHEHNATPSHAAWGGHQSVVFVSSLVCMALPMGYFYSMGRTFVAVLDTFHTSRAKAAAIQSTTIGVFMASGVITGGLIQRFGTRSCGMAGSLIFCGGLVASFFSTSVTFLVVSQGLVVGFGLSLVYICCYTVVGQTFAGRSSLVGLSCVAFASGVGGMIFPYILEYLIQQYGIRGTYLVIGGINMNCLALCTLWSSGKSTRKQTNHEKRFSLIDGLKQLLNNRPFLLFTAGIATINPALSIFLIFVADTILDSGLTESDASLGLLLLSIMSTLGRPVPALLKQVPGFPSLCVPLLASVAGLLGLVTMATVQIMGMMLLSCCLVGLSMGVTIPCYSIVSVRLVGADLLPTAFGFLFTVTAVGNITAPPLSGILRDKTDSYVMVYIVAAAAMFLGGVFFSAAQIFKMRQKQDREAENLPALLHNKSEHERIVSVELA